MVHLTKQTKNYTDIYNIDYQNFSSNLKEQSSFLYPLIITIVMLLDYQGEADSILLPVELGLNVIVVIIKSRSQWVLIVSSALWTSACFVLHQ